LRRCPRRKPASALEYGWVILDDVFDQQDARFNVAQQPRQRGLRSMNARSRRPSLLCSIKSNA